MAIEEQGNKSLTSTVIGPTLVIRGKLKSDEDLVVKGRIDASITTTKSVYIENSGIVKNDLNVKSVRISGVQVGNVVAQERCEIAPDGRVVGDICTPRIVMADGAVFKGKLDYEIPADQVRAVDASVGSRPVVSAPPARVQAPPDDKTPAPPTPAPEEKWQRPFVRPKRGGQGG